MSTNNNPSDYYGYKEFKALHIMHVCISLVKPTFSLVFPQNGDLLVNFFTSNFRAIITDTINNICLVFRT
jgi:hypothetical protein